VRGLDGALAVAGSFEVLVAVIVPSRPKYRSGYEY
jgi:hypothetical protein